MQTAGRDNSICAYLYTASATGRGVLTRLLERCNSSCPLLYISSNANDQHAGLCSGPLS